MHTARTSRKRSSATVSLLAWLVFLAMLAAGCVLTVLVVYRILHEYGAL